MLALLTLLSSPLTGRVFPITNLITTLGRDRSNDITISDQNVSRFHARLMYNDAAWSDEIRIGPFRFIYTTTELTQYDESEGIRIDALNLTKVGNAQTVLLNDISLSIPPRSFVALVGGSGAGKTTLLDALSGLRPAQQGSVFYNGQDYHHNLAAFNAQLGNVPQDDIIHRDLTVERALYYAAKLRLPQDFPRYRSCYDLPNTLDDGSTRLICWYTQRQTEWRSAFRDYPYLS